MSASKEEIWLRFIFPNHDGATVEATYTPSLVCVWASPASLFLQKGTTVREVKSDVLLHRWKDTFASPERVAKLRMFYRGRELKDAWQLRDCHFPQDADYPAACHLFVVLRGSEKAAEHAGSKASRCLCQIS
ncbi:hypothetical protein NCLIV_038480 [Neospora caninum Liverpool]|uniref:UBL3-like ubiquitin domain-containing protein n=1 Tax=Neospora caninum (strain Liverpool) TaxID=572307 RepID=F0VAL8_NEOCL|nr:hypothetical protein NCLIV_038480 [Neospora caninum Liverpool]CBZ50773.1 hypothetical protein NCLIV_038480 [Neospora caninum Liverpool]CEL68073.1 TPA: hypothetical protein BN1204_038480 [Neospora caninum Liverpool]|eukprot:XP_003880806.1 hypothetical protein NCLIV_038480 [Neospora caninum Liverpool]